jgi:hypothetical protein
VYGSFAQTTFSVAVHGEVAVEVDLVGVSAPVGAVVAREEIGLDARPPVGVGDGDDDQLHPGGGPGAERLDQRQGDLTPEPLQGVKLGGDEQAVPGLDAWDPAPAPPTAADPRR